MRPFIATLAALALAGTACSPDEGGGTAGSAPGGSGGTGAGGGTGGDAAGLGAQLDCSAGELLVGETCVPPGVATDGCGAGFISDGDGGCVATLPAAPCADGRMALPGDSACRPLASCGSGTWGDIPTDGATIHVDASYGGSTPDGSPTAPYPTIQPAIDAATSGSLIAIASGTYAEDLVLDKPLTLWGRCPDEVVVGGDGTAAAVGLGDGAAGATVRGVTLTGPGPGVNLQGAGGVTLEQLRIFDTTGVGVFAQAPAGAEEIRVRGCLLEHNRLAGLSTAGATVVMEDTVVRNAEPNASGLYGRGVEAAPTSADGTPSTVTVRRSLIEQCYEDGLIAFGSSLAVEDSLVRDIMPRQSDQQFGAAIQGLRHAATGLRASLEVTRTVVERSHFCGVCATDSELDMDSTTIREVDPQPEDGLFGFGARVYGADPAVDAQPVATIRQSLVERGHIIGLAIVSAEVTVENSIIRDTQPRGSDLMFGRGISVEIGEETEEPGTIYARGVRVETSREVGIHVLASIGELDSAHVVDTLPRAADDGFGVGVAFTKHLFYDQLTTGSARQLVIEDSIAGGLAVAAADVVVEDLVVRNTLPQVSADDFGDGVVVSSYLVLEPDLYPTALELSRATIADNARAGIANFGATVTLGAAHIRCNAIDVDGEQAAGLDFVFEDLGGNTCGCGAEPRDCQVMSSGLQPPMPVM